MLRTGSASYIVYTVESVMNALQCGNQKSISHRAIEIPNGLEKKAGLMKRKRQGLVKRMGDEAALKPFKFACCD